MSLERKLKPDRSFTGALIPLSILPIFGIASLIFGIKVGLMALGAMLFIIALFYAYASARSGNPTQLVFFAESTFLGTMFILFALEKLESHEFRIVYMSTMIFFAIIIILLAVNRRLQWRGRETLELAAASVDETGDGYTARPRPIGQVEYSPDQVRSFARFCGRHLIALPYYSSEGVTLLPVKMGDDILRITGLLGDYRNATWVNFSNSGEVSVHIAHNDYLQYREPLAFDRLCESLGKLFVDFLELQSKGDGGRVINRLDELKLSIFE